MSGKNINRDSNHGRRYHGVQACVLASSTPALALGILVVFEGYDAPGDLDISFGGGGKVTTDFQTHPDEAQAVVLQSDAKIVVVGYAYVNGPTGDFALTRYNSNSNLDDTLAPATSRGRVARRLDNQLPTNSQDENRNDTNKRATGVTKCKQESELRWNKRCDIARRAGCSHS
jgi:hypothetical protein